MLHPYVGFVRDPERSSQTFNGYPVTVPVNDFGYFGPSPLMSDKTKTVVAAVRVLKVRGPYYVRPAGDGLYVDLVDLWARTPCAWGVPRGRPAVTIFTFCSRTSM